MYLSTYREYWRLYWHTCTETCPLSAPHVHKCTMFFLFFFTSSHFETFSQQTVHSCFISDQWRRGRFLEDFWALRQLGRGLIMSRRCVMMLNLADQMVTVASVTLCLWILLTALYQLRQVWGSQASLVASQARGEWNNHGEQICFHFIHVCVMPEKGQIQWQQEWYTYNIHINNSIEDLDKECWKCAHIQIFAAMMLQGFLLFFFFFYKKGKWHWKINFMLGE